MPKSIKSLDEQLEEARRRVVDLARRKRLKEAEEREQERVRRVKQGALIGRRWLERHEALAARDAAVGEREWQEMLKDMDSFLQLPSERRVFGLEKLDAGEVAVGGAASPASEEEPTASPPPAAEKEPKPVRIQLNGDELYVETPVKDAHFCDEIKVLTGKQAKWHRPAQCWYAPARHYDAVVALARRCYLKVELVPPPTD